MSTRFSPGSPDLIAIYKKPPKLSVCKKNPGLWNVIGYESAWKAYPVDLDFLNPNSYYYKIKKYQQKVYSDLMKPFLSKLKPSSRILDVGGGIGRFAIPLAKKGFKVTLVDGCLSNLKSAENHFLENNVDNRIEIFWGEMDKMSFLESNTFDAVIGIEAICYSTNPSKTLKEIVRVAKKGAPVLLSVEGKYGSAITDESVTKNLKDILGKGVIKMENSTYTRYFTKESFKELLKKAGLKVQKIQGCHYGPDGIFNNSQKRDWAWIEKTCSNNPALESLARAWFSASRVVK
jgi:ubiquinone/menaquinone biosynthesis C-methylase UbiE